jgi:hypothetical protein
MLIEIVFNEHFCIHEKYKKNVELAVLQSQSNGVFGELRWIISRVHTIVSAIERDYWLVSLINLHETYKDFVNEKSINPTTGRYWFTHKMVRRSFMVIRNALPDMFQYLENEKIPKSTNGLESFFGHLKGHLNVHRGLSHKHRKQFIQWYLYLKNKQ